MESIVSIERTKIIFMLCIYRLGDICFLNKILMKCATEGPYLLSVLLFFVLNAVGCAETNCIYKEA